MSITPLLTGQELARAIIEQVESKPESHDQGVVHECGSTGCIAGWATWIAFGARCEDDRYAAEDRYAEEQGEEILDTDEIAAQLLGVNYDDFYSLVYSEQDEQFAIENLKELTGL